MNRQLAAPNPNLIAQVNDFLDTAGDNIQEGFEGQPKMIGQTLETGGRGFVALGTQPIINGVGKILTWLEGREKDFKIFGKAEDILKFIDSSLGVLSKIPGAAVWLATFGHQFIQYFRGIEKLTKDVKEKWKDIEAFLKGEHIDEAEMQKYREEGYFPIEVWKKYMMRNFIQEFLMDSEFGRFNINGGTVDLATEFLNNPEGYVGHADYAVRSPEVDAYLEMRAKYLKEKAAQLINQRGLIAIPLPPAPAPPLAAGRYYQRALNEEEIKKHLYQLLQNSLGIVTPITNSFFDDLITPNAPFMEATYMINHIGPGVDIYSDIEDKIDELSANFAETEREDIRLTNKARDLLTADPFSTHRPAAFPVPSLEDLAQALKEIYYEATPYTNPALVADLFDIFYINPATPNLKPIKLYLDTSTLIINSRWRTIESALVEFSPPSHDPNIIIYGLDIMLNDTVVFDNPYLAAYPARTAFIEEIIFKISHVRVNLRAATQPVRNKYKEILLLWSQGKDYNTLLKQVAFPNFATLVKKEENQIKSILEKKEATDEYYDLVAYAYLLKLYSTSPDFLNPTYFKDLRDALVAYLKNTTGAGAFYTYLTGGAVPPAPPVWPPIATPLPIPHSPAHVATIEAEARRTFAVLYQRVDNANLTKMTEVVDLMDGDNFFNIGMGEEWDIPGPKQEKGGSIEVARIKYQKTLDAANLLVDTTDSEAVNITKAIDKILNGNLVHSSKYAQLLVDPDFFEWFETYRGNIDDAVYDSRNPDHAIYKTLIENFRRGLGLSIFNNFMINKDKYSVEYLNLVGAYIADPKGFEEEREKIKTKLETLTYFIEDPELLRLYNDQLYQALKKRYGMRYEDDPRNTLEGSHAYVKLDIDPTIPYIEVREAAERQIRLFRVMNTAAQQLTEVNDTGTGAIDLLADNIVNAFTVIAGRNDPPMVVMERLSEYILQFQNQMQRLAGEDSAVSYKIIELYSHFTSSTGQRGYQNFERWISSRANTDEIMLYFRDGDSETKFEKVIEVLYRVRDPFREIINLLDAGPQTAMLVVLMSRKFSNVDSLVPPRTSIEVKRNDYFISSIRSANDIAVACAFNFNDTQIATLNSNLDSLITDAWNPSTISGPLTYERLYAEFRSGGSTEVNKLIRAINFNTNRADMAYFRSVINFMNNLVPVWKETVEAINNAHSAVPPRLFLTMPPAPAETNLERLQRFQHIFYRIFLVELSRKNKVALRDELRSKEAAYYAITTASSGETIETDIRKKQKEALSTAKKVPKTPAELVQKTRGVLGQPIYKIVDESKHQRQKNRHASLNIVKSSRLSQAATLKIK